MAQPPAFHVWIDGASTREEWPLATVWPREIARGVSLLSHAIGLARAALTELGVESTGAVTVLATSKECAVEAKRLGVDAVVSSNPTELRRASISGETSTFPLWPADIRTARDIGQILLHLRAPLLNASDVAALGRASADSKRHAEVVVPVSRHPIAAFMPHQGRMDFSTTMDGPRWRELEEARVVHCPLVVRARYGVDDGATLAPPVLMTGDELSCFRVLSEADLFVASRVLATPSATQQGRRPWRIR